MSKTAKSANYYDLEDRTLKFAKEVRQFIKQIPKTISNTEDAKQLNNASGSVGANYIEANEAISKKDFIHRIKICRKEVKESRYWLLLVYIDSNVYLEETRQYLVNEATELMKIFGSILEKCKDNESQFRKFEH
ncbi:MAG: four helix bundle protein [Patescibacteria group bacterium]|nr:four helix bundle protein [Patescibacteria group bacterium]